MIAAADVVRGEHDFGAFAASDERDRLGHSKIRTIYHSELTRCEHKLIYRITGSGFLKHMVRNIVGMLLEVGKGNADGADIEKRFENSGAFRPGPTAPPSGLFLISVEYV